MSCSYPLPSAQAEIEECDRGGGGDASVSRDEDVGAWGQLVAAAGEAAGKEDVDALVLPLLA